MGLNKITNIPVELIIFAGALRNVFLSNVFAFSTQLQFGLILAWIVFTGFSVFLDCRFVMKKLVE